MFEIKATILRDDATIGGACPTAEIKFPTNRYEIADALDRARVSANHPGFTLAYYECAMPGLADLLPERVPLEALNLLAYRVAELPPCDYAAFEALLITDTHPKSIGNLLNLTYNLQDCQCADVHNDMELGQFLMDNNLLPDLETVPERVLKWLDYSIVGAAHRKSEHGIFVSGGYVVNDATEWKQVFPDNPSPDEIPEQDVPLNGIFRVHAGRPGISGGFVLPVTPEQERELLARLHIEYFGELVLLGAVSSIPPLNAMLEKYESFDYLNSLAAEFAQVSDADRVKFKAVLDYEGCRDLTKAAEISRLLDKYAYFAELDTPEDYGRWMFLETTRVPPDNPALEYLSFKGYGEAIMERHRARCTPYGIVMPNVMEGENNRG